MPLRRWLLIVLLTAAYVVSIVDRQMLSLLVEPIERDLGIDDAAMGLLQGLAFGAFYTLLGLPAGWLADRVSKQHMIGGAIIGWSVMTALCGFASSFAGLFAARIGVGVGEAGLSPAAAPLIRETMPPGQVGKAMAIYTLGLPLGTGMALLAGAWLLPYLGPDGHLPLPVVGGMRAWQASFLLVALPGLAVGLLLLLLRSGPHRAAAGRRTAQPIRRALRYVGEHRRTFILFMIPGISALLMTFGVTFWIPATFQRVFGLDAAGAARSIGIWGAMNLALGTVGALLAGLIVDRLRARYAHGYLILAFVGLVLPAVSFASFSLMPSAGLALIMLIPAALGLTIAPLAASCAITELAPAGMRALIFSGWMLIMSLLGMSFGPAVIGVLTQHLFGAPDGVRYAIPLLVVATVGIGLPCLLLVKPDYVETARAAARMEGCPA